DAPRRDGRYIRPGIGLSDRDRTDLHARNRGSEPFFALIVGTEFCECGRCHVGLHADRHRDRARAASSELFDEYDPRGEIATTPTPALGIVEAEEPELAATAKQRVGEIARDFPLFDVRTDLSLDKATHRGPERIVFGCEDGVGTHTCHEYGSLATPSRL